MPAELTEVFPNTTNEDYEYQRRLSSEESQSLTERHSEGTDGLLVGSKSAGIEGYNDPNALSKAAGERWRSLKEEPRGANSGKFPKSKRSTGFMQRAALRENSGKNFPSLLESSNPEVRALVATHIKQTVEFARKARRASRSTFQRGKSTSLREDAPMFSGKSGVPSESIFGEFMHRRLSNAMCVDNAGLLSEIFLPSDAGISSCDDLSAYQCLQQSGSRCDLLSNACRDTCNRLINELPSPELREPYLIGGVQSFCDLFSNEAPPGSQNSILCESLTNEVACSAGGCAWLPLGLLAAGYTGVPGVDFGVCRICADYDDAVAFRARVGDTPQTTFFTDLPAMAGFSSQLGCSSAPNVCACWLAHPATAAMCSSTVEPLAGNPPSPVASFCQMSCANSNPLLVNPLVGVNVPACADTIGTDFVEEADARAPGNQRQLQCNEYATENDCRRGGCSWLMPPFDLGFLPPPHAGGTYPGRNLEAREPDFLGMGTGTCHSCINRPELAQHHQGWIQFGFHTAEDPCAAVGAVPGICMNEGVVSWFNCPHICPGHPTSCANVVLNQYEDVPIDEATPGSQDLWHCEAQVTENTCFQAGCVWTPQGDVATAISRGDIGPLNNGLSNDKCLVCIDRSLIAHNLQIGGDACSNNPRNCCTTLANNGMCGTAAVGKWCPLSCRDAATSCANSAETGFDSNPLPWAYTEPGRRTQAEFGSEKKLDEKTRLETTNLSRRLEKTSSERNFQKPDRENDINKSEEISKKNSVSFASLEKKADDTRSDSQAGDPSVTQGENILENSVSAKSRRLQTPPMPAGLTSSGCTQEIHDCCWGALSGPASQRTFQKVYLTRACRMFLGVFQFRPECEQNHPDYDRIRGGTGRVLTNQDINQWVTDFTDEYEKNLKDNDSPIEVPFTDLHANGVDLLVLNSVLVFREFIDMITAEILNLTLTFLLMIWFLQMSIAFYVGPDCVRPGRMLLSIMVIIQPVLAIVMSFGIGHIQLSEGEGMFPVDGDADGDDQDDKILPVTMLSMIGVHLMLAIIVDYDIILVQSFDRVTRALSFEDRLQQGVAFSHRTIRV